MLGLKDDKPILGLKDDKPIGKFDEIIATLKIIFNQEKDLNRPIQESKPSLYERTKPKIKEKEEKAKIVIFKKKEKEANEIKIENHLGMGHHFFWAKRKLSQNLLPILGGHPIEIQEANTTQASEEIPTIIVEEDSSEQFNDDLIELHERVKRS